MRLQSSQTLQNASDKHEAFQDERYEGERESTVTSAHVTPMITETPKRGNRRSLCERVVRNNVRGTTLTNFDELNIAIMSPCAIFKQLPHSFMLPSFSHLYNGCI